MADHVVDFPGRPAGLCPGADRRGPTALYRIYDAADGWVFLAAPAPTDWDDLVAAMKEHIDLAADDRFATPALREENDAALADALGGVFTGRGKDEWEHHLLAADVGCVAVATERIERVLQSDEVGRAGGYLAEVRHPTFDDHLRLAPLVRFSRSATQAKPGVLAGSHTDDVLAELGYDEAAVADLRQRAIIG
jgi:crotonobetainyl-CoA:carnitine CoA-transferase CaiB-like acyl-CoA transferase